MSRPIHVTPTWEHHADSRDCWCEPTVKENGMLVVHHAKRCKHPYMVHHWVWRDDPDRPGLDRSECAHCGQPRCHVLQGMEDKP